MTSKISSLGDSPGSAAIGLGGAVKAAADKLAAGNIASSGPAAPVDKVSLTGDAVRMQQLDKAATAAPVVDGKKVAAIKTALAGGSYRVNSHATAGKLARMDWELGTA